MIIDKLGEGHYTTRNGLPVSIYALDCGGKYPVHGAILKENKRDIHIWKDDGFWQPESIENDLDLIPVAQPLPESETGYKIDLSEASEEERIEAQELAFELGWKWFCIGKEINSSSLYTFYYLDDDKTMSCSERVDKDVFDDDKSTQITLHDLRAAVAHRKQQEAEQPEPKQERPVNVCIPYTNEDERKAAIKQAESYGGKEWDLNERIRVESDDCIWLDEYGDWFDIELMNQETIPLDRSFMESDNNDTNVATVFTFPASDYTKTENEDGTITLTPIDREYQANYEKALNFLEGTPEVMWSREDLAKILVEFLNSVK